MNRLHRIILLLAIVVCGQVAANATDITVGAFSTSPIYQQADDVVVLRLYYSDTFVDSIGNVIVGGALGSGSFYKQVSCTLNATTKIATCNSFTAPSTLDSSKPTVTMTGALYGGKNLNSVAQRAVLFTNWKIPETPTTWSYADLNSYANSRRPTNPDTYYTTAQVDARLALLSLAPDASALVKGKSRLSTDPAVASSPIAVGTNDGRLAKLESDGDLVSSGPVNVGADSDASGTDKVQIQTRGLTRLAANNDGSVSVPETLKVGTTGRNSPSRFEMLTKLPTIVATGVLGADFTNGAPCGTTNYTTNSYAIASYNSRDNGSKLIPGVTNWELMSEMPFCQDIGFGPEFITEWHLNYHSPNGLVTKRFFGAGMGDTSNQPNWFFWANTFDVLDGDGNFSLRYTGASGRLDMASGPVTSGIQLRNNRPNDGVLYLKADGVTFTGGFYLDETDTWRLGANGEDLKVGSNLVTFGTGGGGTLKADRYQAGTETDTSIQMPGLNLIRFFSNNVKQAEFSTDGLSMGNNLYCVTDGGCTIGRASGVDLRPIIFAKAITTDSQITSTLSTGTPPLVVASTTNVPNLNASSLNGATFAAPGAIGGGTPAPATVTTLVANTSLTVNGGTAVTKILSATASLDFTALAANSCEVLTITVTGAADGDTVSLGVLNALADVDGGTERTTFFGWVSGANTVSVRRCNVTGTITSDPAAAAVRATVTKF